MFPCPRPVAVAALALFVVSCAPTPRSVPERAVRALPPGARAPASGTDATAGREAEVAREEGDERASSDAAGTCGPERELAGAPSPWTAPRPDTGTADWVRLSSGEWLKGKIVALQNDRLEFESNTLGVVRVGWSKVAELLLSRPGTVLLANREEVVGTLWLRDGELAVGADEPRRIPRSQVLAIVPGAPREISYWTGKASLGLTLRSGNTDQTEFTALGLLRRRTALTRFFVDYNGSLGRLEAEQNVNNHRVESRFDVFLTRRLYLEPLGVEAFRDPFQNIDIRVTPSAGLGYTLLDFGDLDWEVSVGGGVRYTSYSSVRAGEDAEETTATVRFGTRFNTAITDRVDFSLSYSAQMGAPDVEGTNHHTLALISVELTRSLDLDVSLVWDRVGDPRPSDDGEVPQKDDFRLSVGLGVSF